MKRFALTLSVCALGICAPGAQAAGHSLTPSGNSSINQYVETVPTAHGNRPTGTAQPNRGHHVSGGGGVSNGGGGSGTGGTSGGSSSAISQSTQRALSSHGADGRAAAALAQNAAPQLPRGHRSVVTSTGAGDSSAPAPRTSGGSSALGSLAAALTGSGSTGGLGALLPVILLVVLFGSAATAILRRRSHG